MGYNMSIVAKVPDHVIAQLPLGPMFPKIAEFRPEDYMYNNLCDDPDRLVFIDE